MLNKISIILQLMVVAMFALYYGVGPLVLSLFEKNDEFCLNNKLPTISWVDLFGSQIMKTSPDWFSVSLAIIGSVLLIAAIVRAAVWK